MQRLAAIAAGISLSLLGTGCVRCIAPKCHVAVREAGPTCEVPRPSRSQIYTFLVSGLNPLGSGLDELQATLHRHGFGKIGRAGCLHGSWMLAEMGRIRCADPEARFVLVGVDAGATIALKTAEKALEASYPVDAVVMLDPVGMHPTKGSPRMRTLLLRSGGRSLAVPDVEATQVPDSSPFTIAAQPTTAAAVVGVLEEAAMAVWADTPNPMKFATWDRSLVPGGPLSLPSSGETPDDWSFLNERVGSMTTPLPVAVVSPTGLTESR